MTLKPFRPLAFPLADPSARSTTPIAYLGAIGRATVGTKSQPSVWQYVLLGIGLAATIAATILIGRIARNALKKTGGVNGDQDG